MNKIFPIIALVLCSALTARAQLPRFYNAHDEEVTLKPNSIIIVASQLNCKGCYYHLSKLKKKSNSKISWYSLHDFNSIPVSARNQHIGYLKSYITLSVTDYLFLDALSKTTLRSELQLCTSEATPHLILIRGDLSVTAICYQQIFESKATVKDLAKKINTFFK